MSDGLNKSQFGEGFRAWSKRTGYKGPMAVTRYVMFLFVEELNQRNPSEYIVKGGNLLWHYINTPRPTTDLDLTTLTSNEVEQILSDMTGLSSVGVTFKVVKHQVKTSNFHVGVMLKVSYETDGGQRGIFGIDCVLKTPTDVAEVIFLKREAKAASIENIILDKLNACHKFGDQNTRMKDFDDLYRIATVGIKGLRVDVLQSLAKSRGIELKIDPRLADSLEVFWSRYMQRTDYAEVKTLPKHISQVIEIVNEYLYGL